jgi:predicted nucleic acid-binding protein
MIRVVLDTNGFVSAVLGKQVRPILSAWYAGQLTLVVSEQIVAE